MIRMRFGVWVAIWKSRMFWVLAAPQDILPPSAKGPSNSGRLYRVTPTLKGPDVMHLVVELEDSGKRDGPQDQDHDPVAGYERFPPTPSEGGHQSSKAFPQTFSYTGDKADATVVINANLSTIVLSAKTPQMETRGIARGKGPLRWKFRDGICKFGDGCIYFHARPVNAV